MAIAVVVGQTLTCNPGTWTNNPQTPYVYQWQRDGTTNIGANQTTYVATSADVGHTIDCVVTAHNVGGKSVPVESNVSGVVTTGGSALRWRPPGYAGGNPSSSSSYPGYTVVNAPTGSGNIDLNDSTDYFVNLGHPQWSSISGGGRSVLGIEGGRNVVIVGAAITVNSTNNQDDASALQIDAGNAAGIVHIEGVDMSAPNGITIRTPRIVQIENCRISVRTYQDDISGGVHPDIIQVWENYQCAGIRIDRLSGYSAMTYFSDFTDSANTPKYWEFYHVDLHNFSDAPLLGLNNWMGDPSLATFRGGTGTSNWFETSWETGTTQRGLGDQLRQYGTQYTPVSAGFEILRGGLVIADQVPGVNSGDRGSVQAGVQQGDLIRFTKYQPTTLTAQWSAQIAPTSTGADSNGNYVPATLAGTGYVSPGYQ